MPYKDLPMRAKFNHKYIVDQISKDTLWAVSPSVCQISHDLKQKNSLCNQNEIRYDTRISLLQSHSQVELVVNTYYSRLFKKQNN